MKEKIESAVLEGRIIAIIRGFPADICLRLAEAYAKGGIRLVEVTFNQKSPETWRDTAAAIAAIRERFGGDVLAGAGTVLTEEQLAICIESGGEYMITPNVNVALIRSCVSKGLAAMPGALTPSEAFAAWEAGASFVKIFPAGSFGPGYVKAIRAPLSQIPLLAVGGISPDNVADFMRAGCVGAGVGGNLTNKEWIARGEWDRISDVARQLVENSKV
ncbi:MAG: bifunctional 4-hydroxy-2-oxoglutarate aldolase/2-dehydro-3-deoxy-phosphogluconate aldolase [Kiritimatiellae bacterium]|nr:bifunctional 4-hydroxy-2-oxoglutarate aldolase/2-dehydro-3-deoxy-phosphogluconate aldolase [Kiritimatiellia bacterium]